MNRVLFLLAALSACSPPGDRGHPADAGDRGFEPG